MKSRPPYWFFLVLEIEKGPGPPINSGYADGDRVQMYVSITNTEIVMAILMISRSRGGRIVYFAKGEPRNVEYCKFFLLKCNRWVLRTRKLPDAKFGIHSILRN